MKSALSQFCFSTYFIVNILLILAYPALRFFSSAGQRNLKRQDSFGFSYQNSIIYTALILVVMGYVRSSSTRGFFVELFSISKVGVSALLAFAKFKFSLIYIAVCLVLWLVIPYPKYSAPNRFIRIKSVQQFDQLINIHQSSSQLKVNKKSKHSTAQQQESAFQYQDKWMYFVQFYADWALSSILSKQLWYGYSNKYTTQRMKFLQVNVDRFPQIAKRYKINTSGFSKQIPTLLMITNGQEQRRFPMIDEKNKVSKVIKLDYKILLRYFDLESRYLETREFKSYQNQFKDKNQ